MSQSTDGLLWYGYCWTDENRFPWGADTDDDEGEDIDDRILRRVAGYVEPQAPALVRVPSSAGYGPISTLRARALAEVACEVIVHCMPDDCPMYGVAVKASYVRAMRGAPVDVTLLVAGDPAWLDQLTVWAALLDHFCKQMQIPLAGQVPRWWLASRWH